VSITRIVGTNTLKSKQLFVCNKEPQIIIHLYYHVNSIKHRHTNPVTTTSVCIAPLL